MNAIRQKIGRHFSIVCNEFLIEKVHSEMFWGQSNAYRQNVAIEEVEREKNKVHDFVRRIVKIVTMSHLLQRSSSLTCAFDEWCQLYPGDLNLLKE